MSMNIKRTTLAAAVVAVCAAGMSGQAAAEAFTGAYLNVNNLTIGFSPAPAINSYTFSLSNTASLNGTPAVSNTSECGTGGGGMPACSSTPPVLTDPAANGTGSSPMRNNTDYSFWGPSATGTYANSNSVINTAELSTNTPSSATTVAEAQIARTGYGQANTAVQSTTNMTFTFSTGQTGTVVVSFSADPIVQTALDTAHLIGATGLAKISAEFVLQNGTGSVYADYKPVTGTGGALVANSANTSCTGVTCSDNTAFTLNNQQNLTPPSPSGAIYDPASGDFVFDIAGLPAGTYSMNLSMLANVNVSETVPEPATPALIALGLVGMGATLRRRQAKSRPRNKA